MAYGTRRCCLEDEERAFCKGQVGFVKLLVGVYENPNSAGGAVFTRWRQWAVSRPIAKPPKLLHTSFVEKQGRLGFDLQRSRKFECQTPQENTKQKGGFP